MKFDFFKRINPNDYLLLLFVIAAGCLVGYQPERFLLLFVCACLGLIILYAFIRMGFQRWAILLVTFISFGLEIFPWHLLGIEAYRKLGFTIIICLILLIKSLTDNHFAGKLIKRSMNLIPVVVFFILAAVSYAYTPAVVYGKSKLILLLSHLPEMVFFASMLDVENLQDLKNGILLAGFVAIAAILFNVTLHDSTLTRLGVLGKEGAINLARILGMCAFTSFVMTFVSRKLEQKVFYLLLSFVCFGFILGTATRQAFFSLLIGVMVFIVIISIANPRRLFQGLSAVGIISLTILLLNISSIEIFRFGSNRIFQFVGQFIKNPILAIASNKRIEIGLFSSALDLFQENPIFGGGLGSFAVYFSGVDARLYPHNIILEILAEMGLVGMLIFIGLLFIIGFFIIKSVRLKNIDLNHRLGLVFGLWLITFTNAQFSGDISSNRLFWVLTSILISTDIITKNRLTHQAFVATDKTQDDPGAEIRLNGA